METVQITSFSSVGVPASGTRYPLSRVQLTSVLRQVEKESEELSNLESLSCAGGVRAGGSWCFDAELYNVLGGRILLPV
eukprot:3885147-Rhodomonas_salina.1